MPTTWHDRASARAQWSDAPKNDGELDDLLEATKGACWRFVPRATRLREVPTGWPDVDVPPPAVDVRYRLGQLMHMQSIWQSRRTASGGDTIGLDGYASRVYVFGAETRKILVPPVYGEMVG